MKVKIFTFFSLFVMISNLSVSQSKIYLDEDMMTIDSIQFASKCKNRLLKCLEYSKDTLIIKKVLPKHSFGKINTNEFNQIRLIFEKKTKNKISSNNSLLIFYRDTLSSYDEAKENYKKYISLTKEKITQKPHNTFFRVPMSNSFKYSKLPLNNFDLYHGNWNELQKKCRKKIEKKSTNNLFYVYNFANKGAIDFRKINWTQDPGIFKNKFFSIIGNYKILILKPTGDYFISDGYLNTKKLISLLQKDDWSQYKNDLKTALHSGYGIGFFETSIYNKNSKYCF